ncbi:MAG: hypothetical protein PGN12_01785 [Sphingomonas phyllosphaerae]
MSAAASRELIGLVDASGISVGFLVPIFAGGGGNAPVVQMLDPQGAIFGFEPYEVPDAPKLPSPPWKATIGDPGVLAFAFGRDDVLLVSGRHGLDQLAGRMEDPLFADRPMLGMELADLLGRGDLREQFAAEVHSAMARSSADAANRWRDLSVLTTDVRRELASKGTAGDKPASAVVARVRSGRIELLGLPQQMSRGTRDALRHAALTVVGRLARLYPAPEAGWRVVLNGPLTPAPRAPRDAALLVATWNEDRDGLRGPWPPTPQLVVHHDASDLFSSSPDDFARSLENEGLPLFVVHDAKNGDAVPKARREWSISDVHGIAVGSPRACTSGRTREAGRGTTLIPITGIRGASGSERSLVNAIRLAIAVEVEQRRSGRRSLGSRVLLRSRVARPTVSKETWAALYDKAFGMGLAPWSALRIMPGIGKADRQDPAAEALLGELEPLYGGLIDETLRSMPHTFALLVDSKPRSPKYDVRHKQAVTQLLARQQWGVTDRDFRRAEAQISVHGRLAEFDLLFAGTATRPADQDRTDLFRLDLRRVRTVMVTCAASPTAVLEQLTETGVLPVDVRDLVDFDAAHSSALTILGSQLRRMVTGLPSRTRTRFIAFAAMQAFMADRISGGDASSLLAMLEGARLGREFQLLLRSTRGQPGTATFEVRTFDTVGNRFSEPRFAGINRFRMSLAADGASIDLSNRGLISHGD